MLPSLRTTSLASFCCALAVTSTGRAETTASPEESSEAQPADSSNERNAAKRETSSPEKDEAKAPPWAVGGYVEALYQWNFNEPSNGITNFRGFDNRHNSFTLSNIALDATWDYEDLIGRLTLQVGHTPSTYYLAEPALPGSSGANGSGQELWKYLQQAYAGYRFGLGRGLTVTGGLFLSPTGPEAMAVKDNWNWSRSNLFFGLPFYHTGVRASYALTDTWAITLHGYNGWNSVTDNNAEKSFAAQLTYNRADLAFSLLYFGGVERARDAPEGRAFRHDFDAHGTWHVGPRLSLMAHGNGGFESTAFGVSAWGALALYGRLRLLESLYFAVRGDFLGEHVAENGADRASPLFFPAAWVSSGTATLDYRPHERVSFRFEFRHDQAASDQYFAGTVVGDGETTPYVANRTSQNTLTLGLTTWF